MKQLLLALLLSLFQATSLFAADKMRVAFASFGPALSPAWVTSDKGFWKKQGLDVELIYLGGGSRSVPALLSGRHRNSFFRIGHGCLCCSPPRRELSKGWGFDELGGICVDDDTKHPWHQ